MSSATPLDSSKHLSLIDAGVSNIWSLSLPGHLESLNLHGNYIRHISNLSHLLRLKHLDLSANQISAIDGLESLVCLQTLNLSCNLITSLDGLAPLRSLKRLNLSYNQIDNLDGFSAFSGPSFKLSYIALHGNKLKDVRHLAQSLSGVRSLKHLVLSQDGSGNPLCHNQGYMAVLWTQMPQLETINDMDQNGRLSQEVDSVATIPGLEAYLDFLLSSRDNETKSEQKDPPKKPASLITPKIDAVMEQFKQRYLQESSSSSFERDMLPSSTAAQSNTAAARAKSGRKIPSDGEAAVNFLDRSSPDQSASSGEESEPVKEPAGTCAKPTSGFKTADGKVKKDQSNARKISSDMPRPARSKKKPLQQKQGQPSPPQRGQASSGGRQFPQGRTLRFSDARDSSSGGGMGDGARAASRNDDADTMYKELLVSLESERERRWKAEQAARRMADSLQELQHRGQEAEALKKQAVEATAHIKQAMLREHESNQALQADVARLQEKLQETQDQLSSSQRAEQRSREALKEAETSLGRKDAEEMAARIHQSKVLQEAQQRAGALGRESEALRHQVASLTKQLRQVQETLAAREHQHREDLKHRYTLDCPELKQVLDKKIKAVERSFQADLVKQQEKAEKLGQQYSELETEFRLALHTEETRFREIKTDLEQTRLENVENKQLLLVAQQKDESSSAMIAELTQLVKEQKGRIAELVKCKNEQAASHKERTRALEESLEDSRKRDTQVELLKQAKSRLQATVQAQESVIEGLKAERKLWGQELAQQGASLSQDRGRLEAKIETLQAEIVTLKKQLEREADAVKIKTKMVDDQTETIRKLKEAVVERDETVHKTREESLEVQRSLEDQLAEHKAAVEDTREILDRAAARKEELKQQVAALQAELKEAKDGHNIVSSRWKEKSALIGRLEEQVTQMKTVWTKKEMQLQAERDAALDQARQAVEKLSAADAAFRQQMSVKEAAMQERVRQLEMEKQQEVELANRKVALVEDEMRDMLKENEASKRAMEAKLKKFTQALGDLQTGLS
ncbi:hypothetical protein EGW08_000227 [Elysia chlorotica]|uniref:Leucine-rich repeat and coiled-coil domain-containing protein 1 n=1 Tax=Elysia chlorotica TaxID=188477 RepID=A0A433UE21_ELYCH|nr:hypothetical protein EGW08_000227 [Elysia chlorotica]